MSDSRNTIVIGSVDELMRPATRRDFLRLMGVGGSIVLLPSVLAGCGSDDSDDDDRPNCSTNPTGPGCATAAITLNLSNDTGILQYAYILEQLEAAFYQAVVAGPGFSQLSGPEQEFMLDLRNHEVIHREFFKRVLGTNGRVITPTAAAVGPAIANRLAILQTTKLLEDTGVAAYNGAGKYLVRADLLLIAGKIVSVEARHAAAVRDILDTTGRAFADESVLDGNGLDVKGEPEEILAAANPFIDNTITINPRPTEPRSDSRLPS